MSSVEISVEGFRCHFPEFILATYSDETICRYLCQAEAYCSATNFRIRPKVRLLLIYLMTAHLITLAGINSSNGLATNSGDITGFETSASVDGVSVSKQAPIARNAFEQWINSTGYGQQYWAMLTANVPTPIHYVGNPETFGIR